MGRFNDRAQFHDIIHHIPGTIGRNPSSTSVCPAEVVTVQVIKYVTPRVPAMSFCVTFVPEMEAEPEMTADGLESVPEWTVAVVTAVERVSPEAMRDAKSKTSFRLSVARLAPRITLDMGDPRRPDAIRARCGEALRKCPEATEEIHFLPFVGADLPLYPAA